MDPTLAAVIITALVVLAISAVAITHRQNEISIEAIKTLKKIPKGLPGWPFTKKRLEDKTQDDQAEESRPDTPTLKKLQG